MNYSGKEAGKLVLFSTYKAKRENKKAGADVHDTCNLDDTPLHEGAYFGDEDIVKVLIKAGANVNAMNPYGNTPLGVAASQGHTDIVQVLLEAGANPDTKNSAGVTPLQLAQDHITYLILLIKTET